MNLLLIINKTKIDIDIRVKFVENKIKWICTKKIFKHFTLIIIDQKIFWNIRVSD